MPPARSARSRRAAAPAGPPSAGGGTRRRDRWLAAALLGGPAILIAWLLWRFGIDVPIVDEWSTPYDLDRFLRGEWTLADVLRSHNGHRIALPRLLLVPLGAWSGWNIRLELILNWLAAAALLACLFAASRPAREQLDRLSWLALLGLYSLAVFSPVQWENWLWGVQIQVFLGVTLGVAGLALLARESPGPLRVAGAIACGIGSTLCQAIGLAFWIAALPLVAWPRTGERPLAFDRRRASRIAAWVAITAVVAFLHFQKIPGDANVPSRPFLLDHPVEYAYWVLTGLGAPFLPFTGSGYPLRDDGIAWIAGLFAFVTWLVFSIRSFRPGAPGWLRLAAASGAFAIGMMALAGMARGAMGPGAAFASRYATLVLPLWTAVATQILLMRDGAATTAGGAARGALARNFGLAAIAAGLVAGWVFTLPIFEARVRLLEPARRAVATGTPERLLVRLTPDQASVERGRAILAAHELSVFRRGTGLCRDAVDPAVAADLTAGLRWEVAPPTVAPAGWPVRLRVAVRNDAPRPWASIGLDDRENEAVRLTVHWHDAMTGVRAEPGAEIKLPRDIWPGETIVLDNRVTPPRRPGRYRMEAWLAADSANSAMRSAAAIESEFRVVTSPQRFVRGFARGVRTLGVLPPIRPPGHGVEPCPAAGGGLVASSRDPRGPDGETASSATRSDRLVAMKDIRRWTAAVATSAVIAGFAGAASAQNQPPKKPGFDPRILIGGQTSGKASPFGSQVMAADLGLTPGFKSLIFANQSNRLYVLAKSTGDSWAVAAGWPVTLPTYAYSSPAVADVNDDGQPDIVIGYGYVDTLGVGDGGIRAYRRNGTQIWDRQIGDVQPGPADGREDPVVTAPAIADIDNDGELEVVFGGLDHYLYAVRASDGTNKPGWPRDMLDTVFSSPALFDLDGDGDLEIIVGIDRYLSPSGGQLVVLHHNGTVFPGFPKSLDQVIFSSPAIGDIDGDGDPEIVHGTGLFFPNPSVSMHDPSEKVYAWNCDGSPVWGTSGNPGLAIPGGGQVTTSPALADIDGDGQLEVIFTVYRASDDHWLMAFNGDGSQVFAPIQVRDFWGVSLSAGDPIVADVMGDSGLEILVPSNGEVVIFAADGTRLTDTNGFAGEPNDEPSLMTLSGGLAGVAVTDLETDGAGNLIEVIAVNSNGTTSTTIDVWNPGAGTSTPPWGFFRQNETRLGVAPGTLSCFDENCVPSSTGTEFTPIPPCRAYDSRPTSGGPGAFTNNEERDITMRANACGTQVPTDAVAISINVTVTQPSRAGSVALHMGSCSQASLETISFGPGQTRANNAVLALSLDGNCELRVKAQLGGSGSVHVIIDVNGYFAAP